MQEPLQTLQPELVNGLQAVNGLQVAATPGAKINHNPGLKFSRILPSVLNLNGKNVAGNFVRSDKQGWWEKNRNSDYDYDDDRAEKRRRLAVKEDQTIDNVPVEGRETATALARTLIVHPGSRWLRIGRATDETPVQIPNCIARRTSSLINRDQPSFPKVHTGLDETLDPKIEALRGDLKVRLRYYKLRPEPNGTHLAKEYNESAQVDEVPVDAQTERLSWTSAEAADPKAAFIGDAALRIKEPAEEGWTIRWPIEKGSFNTRGYSSLQEIMGDIAEIWLFAIEEALRITTKKLEDFSVVLVIPDLYDQEYLREMTEMVLVTFGCKQVCFQQESLCASFGTGVSSACVVDLGARKTSIACVDDGMILPESRLVLDVGGDDMTELLYQLLLRISFPYKEADLNRTYDWVLFEYLKESVSVLSEGDVALNLYHFDVRRPGKPLLKSTIKLFDEIIIAPMCLFGPRVINFEHRQAPKPVLRPHAEDVDEVIELGGNAVTNVMRNLTKHLLPRPITVRSAEDLPAPEAPIAFMYGESAKTPLDVAVFESLCTAGTEDKIKRLASSIILCGGASKIHNAGFALQSRLAVHFAARFSALVNQIQMVIPPKATDPQIIVWKGAALLSKLDACQDLWIRGGDWDKLGLRAIKERTTCCL